MAAEQNGNVEAYLHDVEKVFTDLIPSRSNYSVRQEQVKMALATAKAIAGGGVLLAQAGTGVGKTLAYLVPSVIWRTKYGGGQTLIATYTTNLQQQIFDKDYPFVRERLGMPFRLIQALGRTRYLCLMRFYRMLQNIRQYPQYAELLGCISDCIETDNYSLFHPELQEEEPLRGLTADFRRLTKRFCAWDDTIWPHICAESLSCTKRSCRYFHSCYFYKERALLGGADVCVANHALLCAVLRQDSLSRLVPQIGACIIDEAHHFEDVAIEQMSNSFDGSISSEFFTGFAAVKRSDFGEDEEYKANSSEQMSLIDEQIGGIDNKFSSSLAKDNNLNYPSGWFSNLAEAIHRLGAYLPYGGEDRALLSLKSFYYGAFQTLRESVAPYFRALEDYYSNEAYSQLDCFERKSSVAMLNSKWLAVSGGWGQSLALEAEKIKNACNNCLAQLREIEGLWKDIAERAEIDESDNQPGVLLSTALEQLDSFMQNFLVCHDIGDETDALGHWMERGRSGVRLRAARIDISDYLASAFWQQIPSVVATSATLKIDDSFDFFCSRTGIDKIEQSRVNKLSFKSPFHYEYQALLAITSDLGRSGSSNEASNAFLNRAMRFITQAAKLWQGRMLILATSRYEVEKIYDILLHPLAKLGLTLLKQSSGLRAEQIERLRLAKERGEKIVLVGTNSFWEGVDVAGEALSCVVILRLPFTSPDNPFFKIRSKSMGDQAFRKYAIPLAVLKFCQGFGRLVRTEKDRGVVFVLDNRLDLYVGKNYRHYFLHSLPPDCPVIYNQSDILVQQAYQWFRTGLLSADFLF